VRRYGSWLVALLALGGSVIALREATLSTHRAVPPDSALVLTVRGDAHGGERTQTLEERASALILACRLEVNADPSGGVEVLDDGAFRFVLRPSLDRSDRRQLQGCLEDWRVDHVRLTVESMVER
jgi:hypothetical protein